MKKTKKIILSIIVALITLISVFSCFKGKYTPEPILTPVSVLKPANSVNEDIVNPETDYDYLYFNTSLSHNEVLNIVSQLNTNPVTSTYLAYGYVFNEDTARVLSIGIGLNDNINIGIYDLFFSDGGTSAQRVFYNSSSSWETFSNPYEVSLHDGLSSFDFGGVTIPIGQQNNLLTNLISPVPFLFEGTSNNISWTSSGLDNPNNIQNIYLNTNLSNQAIKNILDAYVGTTAGKDIFNYTNGGVLVRCHIINNSANAFIQIIGGSTTLYEWIYDSIDTEESIWWYGINPNIIDNGNVITSPQGNSLNGFNIYELRALFSSSNDFVEQPSGDSYEQGYQDGYTAGETAGQTAGYNSGYTAGQTAGYNQGYTEGETAGYNSGYTAGETAGQTAGYNNGYTAGQTAGYNQGYLDGLDDGADTNISFQYVESVLTLIGNFLNIEVLPGIKLSYALGIVIILTIISIIKMVVK